MTLPESIEDLIYRFLMKEAGKEDIAYLETFLSEHPEYTDEFERICRTWYYGKYTVTSENIETTEAWQKISTGKPAHRTFRWRYWGYAASMLLLLSIGMCWVLLKHSENGMIPQTVATGSPGSSKALLILASGEKIKLDKNELKHIRESGTTIAGDTGMLVYQENQREAEAVATYNELIIPRGGEYSLCLSDGTVVHLNSESRLKYPVTFSGEERQVWLEGEAYFEVKKSAGKRFIVSSSGVDVTVLGTKFNVTSYSGSGKVITTLVEGCVEVSVENQPGKQSRLQPDQQAVFDQLTGELKTREVDVLLYTSWKDGYYTFEQQPIGEIMEILARWYDIDIVFQDPDRRKTRFTGRLKRYDEMEEMLLMFRLTQGIQCRQEGKTVIIL